MGADRAGPRASSPPDRGFGARLDAAGGGHGLRRPAWGWIGAAWIRWARGCDDGQGPAHGAAPGGRDAGDGRVSLKRVVDEGPRRLDGSRPFGILAAVREASAGGLDLDAR